MVIDRDLRNIGFAGLGLGACLFFISMYQAEVENDSLDNPTGAAIGTVISAVSDVSRRPSDRLLWFPLDAQKNVYARDTVRTGPDSSLRLDLGEKGQVELNPDTLAILETENDSLQITLASGDLFIKGGIVARVGDSLIKSKEGSFKVSRDSQTGNLEVQSQSGRISVTTKNVTTLVDSGQKLTQESHDKAKLELFPWAPIKPIDGETITSEKNSDLSFIATAARATTFEQAKLQISRDKTFRKIFLEAPLVSAEKMEILKPMPEGQFFWRIVSANGSKVLSNTQQFTRQFSPTLSWANPFPNPRFKTMLKDSGLGLDLAWGSSAKKAQFQLDIKSADKLIFSQKLGTSVSLHWSNEKNTLWELLRANPKLPNDEITISISALGTDNIPLAAAPIVGTLDILDDRRPADIQNFSLAFNAESALESTLNWKVDPDVDRYEIRIGKKRFEEKKSGLKIPAADVYALEAPELPEIRAFTPSGVAGPWLGLKYNRELLALSTLQATPVKAFYPTDQRVFSTRAIQKLEFQWGPVENHSIYKALGYELRLENLTSGKVATFKTSVTKNSLEIPNPKPGTYLWSVRAEWPFLGAGPFSEAKHFTVKSVKLDAPEIRQPSSD